MIDFGVSCSCSYHVARRGTSFVRPFDGSYFLGRRCRRPFAAGDFFNLLYWWYNYLAPLINRVTLLFMSNKAGEVSLHCKLTWHKKLSAAAAAYNKICPRPEMLFTAAAAHVSERASERSPERRRRRRRRQRRWPRIPLVVYWMGKL